jgi:hypothetical protein
VRFLVRDKTVVLLKADVAAERSRPALKSAICFPKDNEQAGFDMVTVEAMPNDNQQDLVLYFQCKYSQHDGVQDVESLRSSHTVPAEQRLIMVDFRKPRGEAQSRENVLVLTRKTLEQLYGPTLATRPQFLMNYTPHTV